VFITRLPANLHWEFVAASGDRPEFRPEPRVKTPSNCLEAAAFALRSNQDATATVSEAHGMELTPQELDILERDRICLSSQTFRQCFEPYMPDETSARFITSDSLLNGFHVLLEGTVKHLEVRNANRLITALLGSWSALEGNRVARILLGVALRLPGQQVELGPVQVEVEQEVERICRAEEVLLPDWLSPGSLDFLAVDYRRFRVRGFYTGSNQLTDYFRAFSWLKSIPLRLSRELELEAAWQFALRRRENGL
jgi:hypothetical protein